VSCSALKHIYRERLRAAAGGNLYFVHLEGSKELLTDRMGHRKGHFMPTSLLESQLETLEVPTGEPGVVTVHIDDTIEGIAAEALKALAALGVTG
jgi:gluconokinase